VTVVAADLRGRPLRRLPSLEEVIGARARHDIGSDAVVTHADVAAEPLVRAGDIVRARARVGLVEVTGSMVAAESGVRNDLIRVVNPASRHAALARVVGAGEVEVEDVR
jgi:flagella basal body P-ring formation protein FlgA